MSLLFAGVLIVLGGTPGAVESDYERAVTAYEALDYAQALILFERVAETSTSRLEVVAAYERLAELYLIDGEPGRSEEAFYVLLSFEPAYTPNAVDSPKIREAYWRARKRFLAEPADPPRLLSAPATDTEAEPLPSDVLASSPPEVQVSMSRSPIYKRWWFWGLLGVGAGALTGGLLYKRNNPGPPSGDALVRLP